MISQRPLPHPNSLTQPFWDATRRHELRVQQCADCDAYQFPPQMLCAACLSENQRWEQVQGIGTVYSYTIIHRPPTPAFDDEVPYVVAEVELAEGPLMLTNIVGCPPEEVFVGMPVGVTFVDATAEITLYPFTPR